MNAGNLAVVTPEIELTEQEEILVRRGQAALKRGHAEMMELGRVLKDLRAIAPRGRYLAIVDEHFGLNRDLAAMFVRLAEYEPFANVATLLHCPPSAHAMDKLRQLPPEHIEAGIASGAIHPNMTVKNANELVQEIGRQVDSNKYAHHRPIAAQTQAPVAPADGVMARNYLELVWLLTKERQRQGLAQEHLDDLCGMNDAYIGKLEQPNSMYGRRAVHLTFDMWIGGLKCGLVLVPQGYRAELVPNG